MPLPSLLEGVTPPAGIDSAALASAAARVRSACHWHIAPAYQQTWVMAVPADGIIDLDTLRVDSIDSVTVDGVPLQYPADYDWSDDGRVELRSVRRGQGMRSLVIVVTHGYEVCPDDLVQLIAQLAQPGMGGQLVRSEGTGDFTTSYFGLQQDAVVAPYRLPVVA